MADVTDAAFRHIIAKYSKFSSTPLSVPCEARRSEHEEFSSKKISVQSEEDMLEKDSINHYVTWTEFVSADGLALAPEEGRRKLLKDLEYSEIERPIVAQFFTSRPENMEKAARLALELGFDGVDINMGCPDKSIEKQGAGAALIKNPSLAKEIILAAKRGVNDEVPVSVKTRIGYNKDEIETWIPNLLEVSPAVITIHARTRKEMSLVPARWEHVKRAVEIRDEIQNFPPPHPQKCTDIFLLKNSSCSPQSGSQGISGDMVSENLRKTLIFGNGDVASVADAYQKAAETGADGVMLGRAIFGNPFLFAGYEPTWQERLAVLVEHTFLFEEKFGGVKSFAVMKKHFKSYLAYVSHAKEDPAWHQAVKNLREELMLTESASAVSELVEKFLLKYN
jgi:tRNA-dihydrouridine synthase